MLSPHSLLMLLWRWCGQALLGFFCAAAPATSASARLRRWPAARLCGCGALLIGARCCCRSRAGHALCSATYGPRRAATTTLRTSACIPLSNRIATDLALWTGGGVQDYPSSSLPLCGRAYDPGNHGRALSRSQVTAEARASASAHALTQPAPEGTRAPPHRLPDSTVRAQDQLGLGLFWKTLLAE